MCGIAGFVGFDGTADRSALEAIARTMAGQIRYRGPDDAGEWADPGAPIAFGHRRLSIIDTSACGHQPMVSASGRYVICYNGEVYNFPQLRRSLEDNGHRFTGHSDTEVILAAIEQSGVESAVKSFIGMFAFALWDTELRKLFLVRDRLGIKPLYFGWVASSLVFGSELKSLVSFPGFDRTLDLEALALYFRYNSIPAPHSVYKNVRKQLPATILTFDPKDLRNPNEKRYWNIGDVAADGLRHPFSGEIDEATDRLDDVVTDAVRHRLVADVPLGAFLSGGYDSTLVSAIMQRESNRPVRTFSIGFENQDFDESPYARRVANHLGTDHTEMIVSSADAQAVVPELPSVYDEPFSDSSQIPTILVSRLARKHVTVSLSGDGGDELFAGYNRHLWVDRTWSATRRIPTVLRGAIGSAMTRISQARWDDIARVGGAVIPGLRKQRRFGENVHKLAGTLSATGPDEVYRRLLSHWQNPAELVLGSRVSGELDFESFEEVGEMRFAERMMLLDQTTYLPNDILTKVDRASMSVSLEARVPLIDHRVVEFAWTLPLHMKIRNGETKWLLRRLVHKFIPAEFMDRPKAGFAVPIGDWIRGPMREWAADLLSKERICRQGFLNADIVEKKWNEHQAGRGFWQYDLWDVLMFQAWLEETQSLPNHRAA